MIHSQRLWRSQSRSRCFSGILLLFLWYNRCWQFDLWFPCRLSGSALWSSELCVSGFSHLSFSFPHFPLNYLPCWWRAGKTRVIHHCILFATWDFLGFLRCLMFGLVPLNRAILLSPVFLWNGIFPAVSINKGVIIAILILQMWILEPKGNQEGEGWARN